MAIMTQEQKVNWLKTVTQEAAYPMFTPQELEFYLSEYGGDVRKTAYKLLCLKAQNGQIQITGMTLPDHERYFMKLAQEYRPNHSGVL